MVIGYFLKLINTDQLKITMLVNDHRLSKILDAMKLTTVFDVQRM